MRDILIKLGELKKASRDSSVGGRQQKRQQRLKRNPIFWPVFTSGLRTPLCAFPHGYVDVRRDAVPWNCVIKTIKYKTRENTIIDKNVYI